ncbi:MAG: hypothetical protein RXR20_25735 [Paraburkholderia sp.]|uniref:hypothetical protein n=1 Tax=Burkholderiaceae TaxID=119060 RepID=UPI001BB12459|nr:hypothetical protein [Burkholderia sp. 4M9327F10]
MLMFLDQDIAHIACVMPAALAEGRGGPMLSSDYWRRRLHKLLDGSHLTRAQLCALDRLLLQLDAFDARHHRAHAANQSPVTLDISTTRTLGRQAS